MHDYFAIIVHFAVFYTDFNYNSCLDAICGRLYFYHKLQKRSTNLRRYKRPTLT